MKPRVKVPAASSRPLEDITIGISVAYGEDSADRGFTMEEMNSCIVRLAEGLLEKGARLVFGHDWRPDGVMTAIAELAVRYEPIPGRSTRAPARCRITNLVPWDSHAELPAKLREDLERRGMLKIEETSLPKPLLRRKSNWDKPTLRAAALSFLRQRLAELCRARICLGGKFKKYEGFWPGVFEEAWTGAELQQPVFLSHILGGAASLTLTASESEETKEWDFLIAGTSNESLQKGRQSLAKSISLPGFANVQKVMGASQLQKNSRLHPDDWRHLTQTTDIAVLTTLVAKALSPAPR
jgi:hypothetical protein